MPKTVTRDRGTLGESVLQRRIELELTQNQLAEMTGLKQANIAQIETGVTRNPTLDTVVKIAQALKTTVDGLLDRPKARRRSKANA